MLKIGTRDHLDSCSSLFFFSFAASITPAFNTGVILSPAFKIFWQRAALLFMSAQRPCSASRRAPSPANGRTLGESVLCSAQNTLRPCAFEQVATMRFCIPHPGLRG